MRRKKARFLVWVVSGSVTLKKWFSLIWRQHYKAPLQTLCPRLAVLKGRQGYAVVKGYAVVSLQAEGSQCVQQVGDERFLVAVGEFLTHWHEHRQRVGTRHHRIRRQQFGMSTHLG